MPLTETRDRSNDLARQCPGRTPGPVCEARRYPERGVIPPAASARPYALPCRRVRPALGVIPPAASARS
jgi:hypothetical protein